MKRNARLRWVVLAATASLVVGCSKNLARDSVVAEKIVQPHPERDDIQAVPIQSPRVVSPNSSALADAKHDARTNSVVEQSDYSGLSRSLRPTSVPDPRRGATHPEGGVALQQQATLPEAAQGLTVGDAKTEDQEESQDVAPQAPAAEATDPWHHLLQAPASQGEPIIPIEPLDLQTEREALDALVLPEGDPRAALIGCWRQTDGPTTPDFGNGGYTQSFLVFRTDGFVDLVRLYGTDGTIRLIKRYDYLIDTVGLMTLGKSEKYRPQFRPRTQRLPDPQGTTIVITPPALTLPCQVKYIASEKTIEPHGKKYERVNPQEPAEGEQSDH